MKAEPTTLQEAIVYFSDAANCREYLVARRWPEGVTCPRCGSKDVIFLEKYNRWHCRAKHTAPQFTLKTGTIMEDSPIGLDKWLMAMWQIVNCKNGISSYEVHRAIGITQKSAWFLDHRIRLALTEGSFEKLSGHVEADETFIGQKARNMHKSVRARKITGTGGKDKTAVMGILERGKGDKHSKVRTSVIPNRKKSALQAEVTASMWKPDRHYIPMPCNRTTALMNFSIKWSIMPSPTSMATSIPTAAENFWSLLKRGLNGTYVSVEPFHLFRYLDEQMYRFNNRKLNDGERFDLAVRQIVGKRLTWNQLTGKTEAASQAIN